MFVPVVIKVDAEGKSPLFPGYVLRDVSRGGKTHKQWYMVGPRAVSQATKHAEGR